jgi:hypothetical protein
MPYIAVVAFCDTWVQFVSLLWSGHFSRRLVVNVDEAYSSMLVLLECQSTTPSIHFYKARTHMKIFNLTIVDH